MIIYAKIYYFCRMNKDLSSLGNTPVSAGALLSLYPELSGGLQKLSALEKAGDIMRLKRGLYIVSPKISHHRASLGLIANHLCSPSYISMYSALRWYGLIPEKVVTVQSVTIKRSRSFSNVFGQFDYVKTNRDYFSVGLRIEESENAYYVIASPEKALCDLIIHAPAVNLRYKKEAREYLEEDLRLDMDAFYHFDISILKQCAQLGKKRNSIETIIKLAES